MPRISRAAPEMTSVQRRDLLPSPPGRGAGGEGGARSSDSHHGPLKLPDDVLNFTRGLRMRQTDAELRLWLLLRDRRLAGWKFRRQHPIPPYIVDFYCDEARLVVELDGSQHADALDRDEGRTCFLESRGLRVRRYWNNAVLTEIETVLEDIWNVLQDGTKPSPLTPLPEGEGGVRPGDLHPSPSGRGAGGEGIALLQGERK